MSEPDKLLTILEVAGRCNASPAWVRKALRLGLMPFVDLALDPDRKRREPRIWASVVDAFLKARTRWEPSASNANARLEGSGEIKRRGPYRRSARA